MLLSSNPTILIAFFKEVRIHILTKCTIIYIPFISNPSPQQMIRGTTRARQESSFTTREEDPKQESMRFTKTLTQDQWVPSQGKVDLLLSSPSDHWVNKTFSLQKLSSIQKLSSTSFYTYNNRELAQFSNTTTCNQNYVNVNMMQITSYLCFYKLYCGNMYSHSASRWWMKNRDVRKKEKQTSNQAAN